MAPHSSTLAWKIPWTEEPGRLQSMGSLRVETTERLHFHFSLSCIGEGNGNPLQCSCLESPRDGRAWWAAIFGVAQSQTWLKWLGSSSRDFPGDSVVNNGDTGDSCSILRSGRSPGEENGNLSQYSCLGNPIDRGDWWATVHGITKSQAPLSTHPQIISLYQSCYCSKVHWIFKKINQ